MDRKMSSRMGGTGLITALLIAACGGAVTPPTSGPPSLGPSAPPSSPVATNAPTVLTGSDLDRELEPAGYRVGEPFAVPFTVTFAAPWIMKSHERGDVSFVRARPATAAAWLTVDLVDDVFADPCHEAAPAAPPVPRTVDGIVGALTRMVGFTAGPVTDVVVGGYAGKAMVLTNTVETDTAECIGGPMLPLWTISGGGAAATNGGATEQVWVIDVAGTTVVLDGTTSVATPPQQREDVIQAVQGIVFGSGPGPITATPGAAPVSAAPSATPEGSISGRFDIGGRSMFIECRGTGSPTVIFMVGTGAPRTQLRSIEDRVLGRSARVCDYDRAGDGQSDPSPTPQTVLDVVDDLAALLAAAEVPGPYVLVGQSVGGDQAWVYASRHPAGVAGFLIMNAGFFVLDWDAVKAVWNADEIAEERALSEASLGEAKQAASPPDHVPYVVMLSTIAQCGDPHDVCGRIYPFYEEWARELASRTPDGRVVFVDAGHAIYEEQMTTVMDQIGLLLLSVRTAG